MRTQLHRAQCTGKTDLLNSLSGAFINEFTLLKLTIKLVFVRQLFPIQLTHDILTTKLCNKVVVMEVWHKETNRNRPSDELVGLVQLSLHQFYINFTHTENAVHSLQVVEQRNVR